MIAIASSWLDAWAAQAGSDRARHDGSLPWLTSRRRHAFERFASEGWPTTRLENWHHTSLAFLAEANFTPAAAEAEVAEQAAKQVADLRASFAPEDASAAHWLVFVDGHHAPSLSALAPLPQGVRLTSLADALARYPEAVEAHFGQPEEGDSPVALNTALARDGAFLWLPRGCSVEAPIHLVHVIVTPGCASHLRHLVVAEAGASATLIEHSVGDAVATATLSNTVTRIAAAADARITHLQLQQESLQAVHLAAVDVVQARGSSFNSHALSFGAQFSRTDITTRFEGPGCETLFNGLYHADGQRHMDHHTRIDHAQPRGTSREYYRGILDGAARGVFVGRIRVAPGAQHSDAIQRTDSLLLSRRAEADARPELEIYADDVKCAHGATVGQLDETSLFYLRSRGLDEPQAKSLLIYAFATEALARIDLPLLRRQAETLIRQRLPGGAQLDQAGLDAVKEVMS